MWLKAECHAYQNDNINSLQRYMHCCFKLESLWWLSENMLNAYENIPYKDLKDCVHYIFASLFFKSKGEDFKRNKKKMVFISRGKLFLFLR